MPGKQQFTDRQIHNKYFSVSVHIKPRSLGFESFPSILTDVPLSLSNNDFNSMSSYTFGFPLRSLSSDEST